MGYMNNDGLLYLWTKLKTIFVRKVNNQTPDADGNISIDIPQPSSASPLMDGTAAVGTSTKYAREDHKHPVDTSRAASSHTHGNITNAGALQSTGVAIANNDGLVITDSSNSGKVAKSSTVFDGSTETQALSKKGTWVDIPQEGTATPLMDGVAAVGTSKKFAKEDHKHPSDTSKQDVLTFDDAPTQNSNNPVKSGGVYSAISDAAQNVEDDLRDLIPEPTTTTPKMNGTAAVGTETKYAKGDHVHPTDTSRAPIASPEFTGTPKAPTAPAGTNNTQIATTQFVATAIAQSKIGAALFQGVVTANTEISSLTHYEAGWYWVVGVAGTYVGQSCEANDFIFCVDTYAGGYSADDFRVVQNNIEAITNSEIDAILAS